ncbi:hypothetical protein CE91St41_24870 [Oscillospiraceae bacterium]|nr:hypothetical protein CE91St40_12670 [Oscillospiraceae bacterium]BDF75598.1 hypothetical protein CE91St41_24870 [Oscillospiraceae bacterium]
MKNKKYLKKFLATGAALAILLTSALAANSSSWPVYGGNPKHNAVVSSAPTDPKSGSNAVKLSLTPGTSGWDGVDNVPVMQTVDGVTYAYVLFDGRGTNGAQVVKVNCNTGKEEWRTTAQQASGSLNAKSGFQLSTPYLDVSTGTLYVGVISAYTYDPIKDEYLKDSDSKILALTNLDAAAPTVTQVLTGINGQINTPIVKEGNYIYFGTWPGGSNAGAYYQVDVSNTSYAYKTFSPSSYGFYWAGAVSDGTNIYFGSDNGMLYWRSIANFDTVGGELNLADPDMGGVDTVGNIRSTVMWDGTDLYFTSQGGYLWSCAYSADDGLYINWSADLGSYTSTSTPTKAGDRIYVGVYSGFNTGGVKCISASTQAVSDVIPVASGNGFPVQSSILVKGTGTGTDYLYFNTNASTGAGYCYSYSGSGTGTQVWGTAADTYALGGMACDNGYIVFGNDYNSLFIVH